jgi:hypothetical protein
MNHNPVVEEFFRHANPWGRFGDMEFQAVKMSAI